MNASLLPLLALTLLCAVAAVIDARTRRIPNRLVLLGLVGGAFVNVASRLPNPEVSLAGALSRGGLSLGLGLLVCALVPLLLFRLGAMGGGDVKLLAVIGAGVGPFVGMQIQVFAFVVGAVIAIVELGFRGQLKRMLGNTLRLLQNPLLPAARRRPIPGVLLTSQPFGPAIFVAALLVTIDRAFSS